MEDKLNQTKETKGLDADVNNIYSKLPSEVKEVYDILKPLLGPNADITIQEYANLLLRAYALDSLKKRDGSNRNSYMFQMGKELFTDYLKNEAHWEDDKVKKYFNNVEGGKD